MAGPSLRALIACSPADGAAGRGLLSWSAAARAGHAFALCTDPEALPTASDTLLLLIGADTRDQGAVARQVQVASGCGSRLIGLNLDGWRLKNPLTVPPAFSNRGGLFVPCSAPIVAWALRQWTRPDPPVDDYACTLDVYRALGYTVDGHVASISR